MKQELAKQILVADPDTTTCALLRLALEQEGFGVSECGTGDDAYKRIVTDSPALVIVGSVVRGMDGPALCRQVRRNLSTATLPLIMLTGADKASDKIAGFQAGADDCVPKPFDPQELVYRIKRLTERAQAQPRHPKGTHLRGRIIAICSNKGGVGKTMLAVNLAVALQRRSGKRVALLDGDLYCGNVGTYLNLPPVHSIMDLIGCIDELEPDLVDRVLLRHSSGVRVLLNPVHPEQAQEVTPEHIAKLLEFLSELHEYLVVDCQTFLDERVVPILDQASDVLLITTPEIGCLKNMRNLLDQFVHLGLPLAKVRVVLNRANSNVAIEVDNIERTFRQKVAFTLSCGGSAAALSLNRGEPLVMEQPNHPLARQILNMAEALVKTTPLQKPAAPINIERAFAPGVAIQLSPAR